MKYQNLIKSILIFTSLNGELNLNFLDNAPERLPVLEIK